MNRNQHQQHTPGIEDLEHENRLLRARNERLQALLDKIVPRLEQGFGASHAAPIIIRRLINEEGGHP